MQGEAAIDCKPLYKEVFRSSLPSRAVEAKVVGGSGNLPRYKKGGMVVPAERASFRQFRWYRVEVDVLRVLKWNRTRSFLLRYEKEGGNTVAAYWNQEMEGMPAEPMRELQKLIKHRPLT